MSTIDRMKNLKTHLEAQISYADKVDSDWVYILKTEAKKCLELAEAEDIIVSILNEQNVANENRCVCCGEIIPEGRQVCPQCEKEMKGLEDYGR